jgi:hypothetical protein
VVSYLAVSKQIYTWQSHSRMYFLDDFGVTSGVMVMPHFQAYFNPLTPEIKVSSLQSSITYD